MSIDIKTKKVLNEDKEMNIIISILNWVLV